MLAATRLGSAFATGWWFGLGHFAHRPLLGVVGVSGRFRCLGPDLGRAGDCSRWPAGLALFGARLRAGDGVVDQRLSPRRGLRARAVRGRMAARRHLFGGFPWLLPGYIWTPGEPISQLASVFGIYGLTLLTLAAGGSARRDAPTASSAPAHRFAPLVGGGARRWHDLGLGRAAHGARAGRSAGRATDSCAWQIPGLSQAEKWSTRPDQEWRVLAALSRSQRQRR